MERFGQLFRLSAADVEKVFGHPRVVLQRNLDRAAADAYASRLAGIGMAVTVDAAHPPAAAAPSSPVLKPMSAPQPQAEKQADEPAAQVPAAAPPVADAQSAAAAMPVTPASVAPREIEFEFTGNGFEFFRIWIVNLLLSIVTAGIYSAWAKVRTQRYFYGNTRSDGASFEYLADPLKILKGRLVGFALLLIYSLANKFAPLLGAVLMLCFLAIFPWIMVRGLAFRNHNSAWRGVRFGFDGQLGEAYRVFLLWPLLGVLSLGLMFPYAVYRQQQFVIGNSRYGVEPFQFGARPSAFYRIALAVFGAAVGGFLLSMLLGKVFPPLGALAMVAAYAVIFALSNVMFTNLRYNNTRLGAHALQADYRLGSYAMLMFTNTLAIALTLGLFYPWAKVRTARYAAGHIGLVADGDLGEFAAAQREQVSALGGEIGDVFDMDLGI
ncbi:DUF898 family protein [Aromatoleum diolicum]|uniref:DUF898 family protein n=2 Tax=Aromatoleum diolicum TaxID=75796 RepID=A0ABX1QFN7_9RHOO|nr:DUF898 family protein [Aromatoleum diolicum]